LRYRKLAKDGDYRFGHAAQDFWVDVPDAVGQAVLTRLRLWQGEWFLDRDAGTPYQTQVLGKYTGEIRDVMLQSRVLDTPGALEILSYSSDLNRDTRGFNVDIVIDTIYGQVPIVGPI
jgi:hypothetical protein